MSLSHLHASGTGVAKNAKKAKRLFERACKLSHDQVSGCRTE
jgi:TPR repeat protein